MTGEIVLGIIITAYIFFAARLFIGWLLGSKGKAWEWFCFIGMFVCTGLLTGIMLR